MQRVVFPFVLLLALSACGEGAADQNSGGAPAGAGKIALPSAGSGGGETGQGNAEPGALGSDCSADDDCDSAHCAAGVCCESACAGLCESCGDDGVCDGVPEADSDCPEVDCAVSDCATFAAPPAGACQSQGVCEAECTASFAEARVSCGDADGRTLCDGAGTCSLPNFDCGDAPCLDEATPICCLRSGTELVYSCVAQSTDCVTNTSAGYRATRLTCRGPKDCREGDVCCRQVAPSSGGSDMQFCAPQDECAAAGYTYQSRVCDEASDCDAGDTCAEISLGIKTCR